MTCHYSYLVCPLGEYRKFYQTDVRKEWAEGRIRIFHMHCRGLIVFSRDQRHEYLKCTACGSRLAINFSDVSSAILAVAIAREGTQAVTDQIQFSYLDPGEIPTEW
jgi:hypothetical protein